MDFNFQFSFLIFQSNFIFQFSMKTDQMKNQ